MLATYLPRYTIRTYVTGYVSTYYYYLTIKSIMVEWSVL